MYQIIEIESNMPILDYNGNLMLFDSVNDAIELIKELSQKTYKRYKPDVIVDDSWKIREQKRLNSGEYIEPKWVNYVYQKTTKIDSLTQKESLDYMMFHKEYLYGSSDDEKSKWTAVNVNPEHFLHVSNLEKTKIAFTVDPQKGMLDRQTQMNVASYLVNHCNIDNDLARYIAMYHANEYSTSQVLFAESANDIANVYINGPDSCMGGLDHHRNVKKDDEYYSKYQGGSFCQPTRVYGDSDFKLAYLKDRQGKITARTLVVKDSLKYLRIYGDSDRLRTALKDMGYSQDYDAMLGKKIKKIWDESKDEYVLPYLDGIQTIDSKSNDTFHIITDSDFDMKCDKINGLGTEYNGFYINCYECDDEIDDSDNAYIVYYGRNDRRECCSYCARNESFRCQSIHEYVNNSYHSEVDSESYAEWVAEDANYCDFQEMATFSECYSVICNDMGMIRHCSENVIDDFAFRCRIDGEYYHNDLMVIDEWCLEPRYINNEPNDKPENKESE
jgi:hypothetical protein